MTVYLTNLFRMPELCAKPTDHNEASADASDSPEEMLINETVFWLESNRDKSPLQEVFSSTYLNDRRHVSLYLNGLIAWQVKNG